MRLLKEYKEELKQPLLSYSVIITLNGNIILKKQSKVKDTDEVEIELYGDTLEDIKEQFKQHKKELKRCSIF